MSLDRPRDSRLLEPEETRSHLQLERGRPRQGHQVTTKSRLPASQVTFFCYTTLSWITWGFSKPETWKPVFQTFIYFSGNCKTLHSSYLRNVSYWGLRLTWGTHLGDTKLVASITGSPAAESMFISLIFMGVGMIFCDGETPENRSAKLGIKCSQCSAGWFKAFATACTSLPQLPNANSRWSTRLIFKLAFFFFFCNTGSFSLEKELIFTWKQYFPPYRLLLN